LLSSSASVPSGLVHPAFVAVPLSIANVELDYAAYMASPDVIRVHSDGRWAVDGFTLEDDRNQAAAHHAEHQARRAFTFLLLDPTKSQSLGCVYVNPLRAYLRRAGGGLAVGLSDGAVRPDGGARAGRGRGWLRAHGPQ
jgi:hypothetical protein